MRRSIRACSSVRGRGRLCQLPRYGWMIHFLMMTACSSNFRGTCSVLIRLEVGGRSKLSKDTMIPGALGSLIEMTGQRTSCRQVFPAWHLKHCPSWTPARHRISVTAPNDLGMSFHEGMYTNQEEVIQGCKQHAVTIPNFLLVCSGKRTHTAPETEGGQTHKLRFLNPQTALLVRVLPRRGGSRVRQLPVAH